ncbi:MAG TPA: cytochrome c [Candidatus Baltobacteraceae bacterium]|jgi:mono/diheme cytochrome c family protein
MSSASKRLLAALALVALTACASHASNPREISVLDVDHGKAVFAANCAVCHGATGVEGGVGPSLRDEKSRMDLSATIEWIKLPQPPMPKLYPKYMTDDDVRDVAEFVHSL